MDDLSSRWFLFFFFSFFFFFFFFWSPHVAVFLRNSLIFCQQLFHPTTFRNCTLHNLARLSTCGDDVAAAGDTTAYGDDGDGVMIARQQSNQWNRVSACKVLEKKRKEKKRRERRCSRSPKKEKGQTATFAGMNFAVFCAAVAKSFVAKELDLFVFKDQFITFKVYFL